MARRTAIRTGDLVTWVSNIKNTLSEELVEQVITDLKNKGPYWTGTFEKNWVVQKGSTSIQANSGLEVRGGIKDYQGPTRNYTIPKATGRKSQIYTIGNTTSYRDIAMDLDPERRRTTPEGKMNTAEPDWYLNYMQNEIYSVVPKVVDRVANQSDIKNYKGRL